ncbi:hypothetical protein GALL_388700 [mine drainage metagenome]|uniref:Uncharacterized protein n=1 Tax=mine drainage metagenome TaxID=410659 RepID=A0A1J5QHC0_9ZZZZ
MRRVGDEAQDADEQGGCHLGGRRQPARAHQPGTRDVEPVGPDGLQHRCRRSAEAGRQSLVQGDETPEHLGDRVVGHVQVVVHELGDGCRADGAERGSPGRRDRPRRRAGDGDAVGRERCRQGAGRVEGRRRRSRRVLGVGRPSRVHREAGDRSDVAVGHVGGRPPRVHRIPGEQVVVVREPDRRTTGQGERTGDLLRQVGEPGPSVHGVRSAGSRSEHHVPARDQDDLIGALLHDARLERARVVEATQRGRRGEQLGGRRGRPRDPGLDRRQDGTGELVLDDHAHRTAGAGVADERLRRSAHPRVGRQRRRGLQQAEGRGDRWRSHRTRCGRERSGRSRRRCEGHEAGDEVVRVGRDVGAGDHDHHQGDDAESTRASHGHRPPACSCRVQPRVAVCARTRLGASH